MCLRYPGGKSKAAKLIHSLAPYRYSEYREPFLGSGAVAWLVPEGIPMWLNDKHDWVVWYHEALRDDLSFPATFEKLKARLTSPVEKKKAFLAARARLKAGDYRAMDYLLVNRLACQAIMGRQRKDIASLSSTFLRDGLGPVNAARLTAIGDILRRPEVRLTCGAYAPLLAAPGEQVWIYCDPTYIVNNHKSPLYEHYISNAGHELLAQRLAACTHKVLLSHGSSRFVRDLYSGWRVRSRQYSGTPPYREHDAFKEELMLSNY